jgi:hypothetical protein
MGGERHGRIHAAEFREQAAGGKKRKSRSDESVHHGAKEWDHTNRLTPALSPLRGEGVRRVRGNEAQISSEEPNHA